MIKFYGSLAICLIVILLVVHTLQNIKNEFLISIVGVIYFIVSINSFYNGQLGLGISFLGYSIGSIGLYFQSLN
jgi:hypothetical protein